MIAGLDAVKGSMSGRILRVIVEVARAAGAEGMVEGQYEQVLPQRGQSVSRELGGEGHWVKFVSEKKDGPLHACGAACGTILGGGREEEIERLRRYGLYVGMIQGICQRMGREEETAIEMVEGLRELALKEVKDFSGAQVEAICGLVNI
ncbi:hypothetical protein Ancab_007959 [Ancistrocladus abbreviatus]